MCIATEIPGFERQGVVYGDHPRRVVCGGVDIGQLAFGRHAELVDLFDAEIACHGDEQE